MSFIFSSLFFLMSSFYILKTAKLVVLIHQLNETMVGGNSPAFHFLLYIPLLVFLPCMSAIASVIFFHSTLKIRQPTPLSLILAVLFLLFIPFPFWYMGYLMINPIYPVFFRPFWQDETLILAFFTLILLFLNRKNFHNEGVPLQKKSKLILLGFFCLFTLPILFGALYIFYKAKNPDYKLYEVQKKVAFYVYEPTLLPGGRIYETTYFIPKKGLFPKSKTAELHVNYPMIQIIRGKKSGLIIIKQAKPNINFDIKTYLEHSEEEIKSYSTIIMKTSSDKRLYMKTKKNALYFYFLSKKNTFIKISAFNITKNELLVFAESFE